MTDIAHPGTKKALARSSSDNNRELGSDAGARQRDAERTQQAILAAARDEFAKLGLGGARVERIAERAGVNKKLLYYYFESKEHLFKAVLDDTYAHIRHAERELHLADVPPVEAIRRLVEFTWNYYLDNPHFLSLLNAENMYGASHVLQLDHIREVNSPLMSTLGDVLERGRGEGVFRGGVDPLQLYISIAALAYFYLSNNATLSAAFGRNLMTPKALNERRSHVVEMVLGYLLRE